MKGYAENLHGKKDVLRPSCNCIDLHFIMFLPWKSFIYTVLLWKHRMRFVFLYSLRSLCFGSCLIQIRIQIFIDTNTITIIGKGPLNIIYRQYLHIFYAIACSWLLYSKLCMKAISRLLYKVILCLSYVHNYDISTLYLIYLMSFIFMEYVIVRQASSLDFAAYVHVRNE